MTKAEKAMLLSGLVFPGLGQLLLKCYLRGIALTLASFACLYVLTVSAVRQVSVVLDKLDLSSGVVDVGAIVAAVSEAGKTSDMGAVNVVGWLLLVLWVIGIADAYVVGSRRDRRGPSTHPGKH